MANPVDKGISPFSPPRAPAQKRVASSQESGESSTPSKMRRVASGSSSPLSSPVRRPLTQTSQEASPNSLLLDTPPRRIEPPSSSLLTSPGTRLATQFANASLSPSTTVSFMRDRLAKRVLGLPSSQSFLQPPPAARRAHSLFDESSNGLQEPIPSMMQVDEDLPIDDDCLKQAKIIHTNFGRYAPKSNVAKLDAYLASISEETFPKFRDFICEVFIHVEKETDLKKLAELAKGFSNHEKNSFSIIIFDLLSDGETSICLSLLYTLMKKMDPQFQPLENCKQIINKSKSASWSHLLHAKPDEILTHILDKFELQYAQTKDSSDKQRIMAMMIRDELNPILIKMSEDLEIDSLNKCFETIKKHIVYLPDTDNICLEEREPLLKMALRALKTGGGNRHEPFFHFKIEEFKSIFVLNHNHLTHPELSGQIPQGLHLWPSSRDATSFHFESEGLYGAATRREPKIGAGPITFAPFTVDASVSGFGARAVHANKISSFFPSYMDLKELAIGVSQIIRNPLNDVRACTREFTEQYFGGFKDPKGIAIHATVYVCTNSREDGTKVDPDGIRQICSAFPVITRSSEGNPFPLRLSRTVKSDDGMQHEQVLGSPLRVNQNTPTKPLKEMIAQNISPIQPNRNFRLNLEKKIAAFFADKNTPYKLFPSIDPEKYIICAPLKACTGKTLQESMIRAIPLVKDGAVMKPQEIERAFESIRSPDVDVFWIIDREEIYQLAEEVVSKK